MSKLKIYDENDNFLGEYIGDFVEDTKENVSESFDTSLGSGLLAILCVFAIRFPWLIFVIVGWFILKLIWTVVKFIGRNLWWVLRLGMQCLWWFRQVVIYRYSVGISEYQLLLHLIEMCQSGGFLIGTFQNGNTTK